jgi:hypothetical protein
MDIAERGYGWVGQIHLSKDRPAAGCYGHGNTGRVPRRTEKF